LRSAVDVREVLARVVDGSRFEEFKPRYGTSIVCGRASIDGYPVGILGNNWRDLPPRPPRRRPDFIQLCNQIDVPLVFFQNITGYMVGRDFEADGIIKKGSQMLNAVTNSTVPHLTVIIGASYGAGTYGMSRVGPSVIASRSSGRRPRSPFMGPKQIAGVMSQVRRAQAARQGAEFNEEEDAQIVAMVEAVQEKGSLALVATGCDQRRRDHRPPRHPYRPFAAFKRRTDPSRSKAPAATESFACEVRDPARRQPRRDRSAHSAQCSRHGTSHRGRLRRRRPRRALCDRSRRRGAPRELSISTPTACSPPRREAGHRRCTPEYGFLSENAAFAQRVIDAGLVWVGPPPAVVAAMGDKIQAKRAAVAAGVPTLPSSESADGADEVGFPLLVKALAGGGGKGMRIVRRREDLDESVAAARREALASFGDDTIFLERYVERSRHVEIQILGDQHGQLVHLGERERSIQRRHQKLIEESPSPVVDADMRAAMGSAALSLARSLAYESAGTVEFLVDDETCEFYFLEVNTRLQVEHPGDRGGHGTGPRARTAPPGRRATPRFGQSDVYFDGHRH
jgi:hypothetical protein